MSAEGKSSEFYRDLPVIDGTDSFLYMMLRRLINGDYAKDPVDFNMASLQMAEGFFGQPLTPAEVIIDVGSSSGEIMAEAASIVGTRAQIVCVEPNAEIAESHQNLSEEFRRRIKYLRATGEQMPFGESVAAGVTMHNVIFRSKNAQQMLSEAKRVVQPGGFIAISSNARGHAYYRHLFEQTVAKKVREEAGLDFTIPAPPAEGHYMENLPDLIARVGELVIMEDLAVIQDTESVITRGGRQEDYLDSIKFSAANTDVAAQDRAKWRDVVDRIIKPIIDTKIYQAEQLFQQRGITSIEPYFADPIQRGMIVVRNDKST